jgi:hypothetical protein
MSGGRRKKMRNNSSDPVEHPAHYTAGDVECIDALMSAVAGMGGPEAVLTAHVIRYMWRWGRKNGAQDLNKARWYLDRLISRVRTIDVAMADPMGGRDGGKEGEAASCGWTKE